MRKVWMAVAALALVVPAASAQQQQDDKQAVTRREMQQKMRQLEQQMRDLQREMSRLEPETARGAARAYVRTAPSMVQAFGSRAQLGVTVRTQPKNPATDSIGAVLEAVTPGGGADEAGLKPGDIITAFNGEKLTGRYPAAGDYESEAGRKLVDFARELDEGDTVVVDYRRAKETHRATIVARRLEGGNWGFAYSTGVMPKIELEPGAMADAARVIREGTSIMLGAGIYGQWLDLELVALNPELGDYFGTTEGLLVIRAPGDSTLELKGGDVILAVDGRRPSSQAQLMRILRSYAPGEDVKLDIMRQKRRMTLAVKIPERRTPRDRYDYQWDWNRQ